MLFDVIDKKYWMYCNESFTYIFVNNTSSYDDDLILSQNCIPNWIKLMMYIFWLLMFGWKMIDLIITVYKKEKKCNVSNKMNCLMLLCCAIHILLMISLLLPYRNGWYYIIYSFHMIPLYCGVYLSVINWIRIYNTIKDYNEELNTKYINTMRILYSFLAYINIGFIVFWFLIPMIYFNHNVIHNISYSLGYLHNSVCAIISTLLILYNGYQLMRNVMSNAEDLGLMRARESTIDNFMKKMKTFMFFATIIGSSIFMMFMIFVWYIIDNQMKNIFYFEFIISIGIRFASVMLLSWLVDK